MLEPDVRQQDDARVEHVRRVEATAETGLDRRNLDTASGEVGESSRRQQLELRRVREPRPRRGRAPTAASKPAGSVSSRSHQPATCGDVYAPVRRPSAARSAAIVRVAVDFPFVPTT